MLNGCADLLDRELRNDGGITAHSLSIYVLDLVELLLRDKLVIILLTLIHNALYLNRILLVFLHNGLHSSSRRRRHVILVYNGLWRS